MHVSVEMLDFPYLNCTKNSIFLEHLVMVIRTWLFLFCQFTVFRLHAILLNSAGAVQGHSGKGAGYCYVIG